MKILIDADGCPVTGAAVEAARENGIQAVIFCDTSHILSFEYAETVTVSKGADSADFALVNRIEAGDIVVTQDYGLAAMALAKKGRPLTQNGLIITNFNIASLLDSRHLAKQTRRAGGRLKGPSKRTAEQDKNFCKALSQLIKSNLA